MGFFLKMVDAQITFVTDAQGKVTELVLHQSGLDHAGKRINYTEFCRQLMTSPLTSSKI